MRFKLFGGSRMPDRQNSYGPFNKLILIPCWIVQLIAELTYTVLLALVLSDVISTARTQEYDVSGKPGVTAGISILFTIITMILTASAIFFYAKDHLTPKIFAVISGTQSLIWALFYILDIIAAAHNQGGAAVAGGAILTIFLLSFAIPLAHTIFILRQRTPMDQSTPLIPTSKNVKPEHPHESWTSFNSHSTAYTSITPDHDPDAGVEPYLDRDHAPSAPFTPPHDSSAPRSYFYSVDTGDSFRFARDHEHEHESPPQSVVARKPSYNHARDTRFDEYVSRKASVVSNMSTYTAHPRGSDDGAVEGESGAQRPVSSGSVIRASRGLRSFSETQQDYETGRGQGLGIVDEGEREGEFGGDLAVTGGGGDTGEQRAFAQVVGMEPLGSPEFKVSEGDASRILGEAVPPGQGRVVTPKILVEEPPEDSSELEAAEREGQHKLLT